MCVLRTAVNCFVAICHKNLLLHAQCTLQKNDSALDARDYSVAMRLLISFQQDEVDMDFQDTRENGNQQSHEKKPACAPRDWERSEWFRRWLELIRGKKPQGAGC